MIYLPWVVFLLGMGFMTWQGFASKKEYLRRKAKEQESLKAAPK
jgi:hypothetical protein